MDVTNFIALCKKSFREHPSPAPKSQGGYKAVYSEAREKISNPQDISAIVKRLSQELVINHYRDNLDYERYIPVLQSIREAARKDIEAIPCPTETDWPDLIKTIIRNRSELHYFSTPQNPSLEAPLHNFARAYVLLKREEIEFIETNNELCISEKSYDRINTLVDNICTSTGGKNLIAGLAKILSKTYNPKLKRFTELRNVSLTERPLGPAIPFGYLVALTAKYASKKGYKNTDEFEHLFQLTTSLVSTFEIQPNSQWETLYVPNEAILKFVRDNILYDNLVGLHQTNHNYAKDLINYLLTAYKDSSITSFGASVRDTGKAALSILSLAKTKSFKHASENEITNKARIQKEKTKRILENLLSAPANKELDFPPRSLNTDHYFKPAIAANKNYIIYPKSISALGCINAVCHSITHPNEVRSGRNEDELGLKIEQFLRNTMISKGIKVIHGKYHISKGKELEADMICEDENTIYIFEIKKKVLTREAQSGNEADVLKDLAKSILATQFQAMRLESELKKHGHLTLTSDNTEKTIHWNNRKVKRISVSFHDFGAVQDKTFTMKLLQAAMQIDVHHPDPTEDKKLDSWRAEASQIRALAEESGEIGADHQMPFHNSLAVSIPQIYTLLENSITPDEFFKHISYLISNTTGTRSLYSEILNNQRLIDHSRTNTACEHQPDQSTT
mgnify:CR=1 FL=1